MLDLLGIVFANPTGGVTPLNTVSDNAVLMVRGMAGAWFTVSAVFLGMQMTNERGHDHLPAKMTNLGISGAIGLGAGPLINTISSWAGGASFGPLQVPDMAIINQLGDLVGLALTVGIMATPQLAWRAVKGLVWSSK